MTNACAQRGGLNPVTKPYGSLLCYDLEIPFAWRTANPKFKVEGYIEEIVNDFERRLDTIFSRQVNRVHILDFEELTVEMTKNKKQALTDRLRMVYTGAEGQVGSFREIADKGDLSDYWARISSDGDFLRVVPSYTSIRDPLRRLCDRLIAVSISGRGQAPKKVTATDLFYLRRLDEGNRQYHRPFPCCVYVEIGRIWAFGFRHTLVHRGIVATGLEQAAEYLDVAERGCTAIPSPYRHLQHFRC
ncbi:hypothetical protein Tco_0319914 [Tanacetum coccineum]